jgi:hypothetical protein
VENSCQSHYQAIILLQYLHILVEIPHSCKYSNIKSAFAKSRAFSNVYNVNPSTALLTSTSASYCSNAISALLGSVATDSSSSFTWYYNGVYTASVQTINCPTVSCALQNSKMRIGSGVESSFNLYGFLKQPFYYSSSASTWYKLT